MLALAAGVLAPTSAMASQGAGLSLMYEARFLGLPVGDVAIHLNHDQDRYAVTVNGRATGLFWTLKGIRVHRAASGLITSDGEAPRPERYRRAYLEWEKQGETVIDFDTADGVPQVTRNGNPEDRVPAELRAGSLDPLSAMLGLRRQVIEAAASGSTDARDMVLPVLEGKLRYDVKAHLSSPTRMEAGGQPWRVRTATVTFDPKAGFSEKHAAEYREGGISVSFTDHENAIPVLFDLDQGWGSFQLVYVGRCGQQGRVCPTNEVDAPD
jgi:hypothetical protein